jgi:signal transduction histidine kinase
VNWLGRLHPRRHLAAAIGWSVLAVVALASLAAANLAAVRAEAVARADTERLLVQFATQVRHALMMNLQTRLAIVQTTAAQIAASGDWGDQALRRHLDAVQTQFPEFAWLGVADADGQVVAATGDLLRGQSVATRPWFVAARQAPFLGDVHDAMLLAQDLPQGPDGQPLRFVDAAAPIAHGPGAIAGVVGGHLSWAWIDQLQAGLLRGLDTRRTLELLLANGDGVVLAGPPGWVGRTLTASEDAGEAGLYLIGSHAAAPAQAPDLGWRVVVRQSADVALQPARALHRTVFNTVLLAGLLAAVLAMFVTRALVRRLEALAEQAAAVRRGARSQIAVPAGDDEVQRIGTALAELVAHLQQEKAALAALNAELDARVAERGARIERMAEEARHAAVTRERLRLARDLHDTLAHSLMALLTQIRLVRKLKDRLPAQELAAELERAEAVASSGLAEARAAITQMRHGSVRENGLAAALRELLVRFGERTGMAATLHAAGRGADLADERVETLYRIVEEALRNVERHARAGAVQVVMEEAPADDAPDARRLRLTVQDDGVGFDPAAPLPGHYGLLGMREQAALVGATLQMHSAPGQGCTLTLELAL